MSKYQEIRATFDRDTITVYQAYNAKIASVATKSNKFKAPFSFQRMTWIKPSFLWLMARSNWASKSNQEHTLQIKIYRNAWEKALSFGILTDPDAKVYKSGHSWEAAFQKAKVHVQWDPERNIRGTKLEYRTIQVGISRALIQEYNEEWIYEINDITALVHKINQLRKRGKYKEAKRLLPVEKVYPLENEIAKRLGI